MAAKVQKRTNGSKRINLELPYEELAALEKECQRRSADIGAYVTFGTVFRDLIREYLSKANAAEVAAVIRQRAKTKRPPRRAAAA